MSVDEAVQKALENPEVISAIRETQNSFWNFGFLIYVEGDDVFVGGVTPHNVAEYMRIGAQKYELKDPRSVSKWREYSLCLFDDLMDKFTMDFPDNAVLIGTSWSLESSSDDEKAVLTASQHQRLDWTILWRVIRPWEQYVYAFLQNIQSVTVFVKGNSLTENPENSHITIYQDPHSMQIDRIPIAWYKEYDSRINPMNPSPYIKKCGILMMDVPSLVLDPMS